MKLYTAQYRYAGADRLDITVKGRDLKGIVFAPSWKMVMGSKEEKLFWDEYQQMYRERMQKSYFATRDIREEILSRDEVRLVCFCKVGTNCHRYLLADCLAKLGAKYLGGRLL